MQDIRAAFRSAKAKAAKPKPALATLNGSSAHFAMPPSPKAPNSLVGKRLKKAFVAPNGGFKMYRGKVVPLSFSFPTPAVL